MRVVCIKSGWSIHNAAVFRGKSSWYKTAEGGEKPSTGGSAPIGIER